MTTPPTAPGTTPGAPTQAPDDARLLDLARAAAARAYVPYGTFPVGAALLLANGEVVTGCNVENASYGLTICAERTAATRMIVASGQDAGENGATRTGDRRIVTAAVVGLKASPCFPCGACRQVLHEFGCERVVVEEDGAPRAYPFAEILPHGFGPADLEDTARTGGEG